MNNPFTGIISTNFKDTFNNAIDSLLEIGSLSNQCRLYYNPSNETLCHNCIFDPLLDRSSGRFNTNGGTVVFPDGSVCPVCVGVGKKLTEYNEIVNMAVILDSKYWLNTGPDFVQNPNIAVQTLSKIELLPKINNATHMMIIDEHNHANIRYMKSGFPTMMGLGDLKYVLVNWIKA